MANPDLDLLQILDLMPVPIQGRVICSPGITEYVPSSDANCETIGRGSPEGSIRWAIDHKESPACTVYEAGWPWAAKADSVEWEVPPNPPSGSARRAAARPIIARSARRRRTSEETRRRGGRTWRTAAVVSGSACGRRRGDRWVGA